MKKYLTLAVVLGAVAIGSASYLAYAEPQTGAVKTAIEKAVETKAEAVAAPVTTDVVIAPAATDAAAMPVDMFAKDSEACAAVPVVADKEGKMPSDADKAAALDKCMMDKGHTAEELKTKAEEAAKAAEAAKGAVAPAPAAVDGIKHDAVKEVAPEVKK